MENKSSFGVPILFILFNRPEHARRVLKRIRQVQPAQLFVAIDGPRVNIPSDNDNVQRCIALLDEIDWPCTVTKLIRNQNLGCKKAVSSAIDWFFKHVEAGIILEDDCLPDVTFFEFCRQLLLKYADEYKVMHIGGANLYGGVKWGPHSYFFSYIPHVWGWATWRRAWALYDVNMGGYQEFKQSGGINKIVTYTPSRSYWKASFENTYSGVIDTWDYQWVFTMWKNQGLSIIPNQNLISNIGFGKYATHTISDSAWADLPTVSIDTSVMNYPSQNKVHEGALKHAFLNFYQLPSWWSIKIDKIRRLVAAKLFG